MLHFVFFRVQYDGSAPSGWKPHVYSQNGFIADVLIIVILYLALQAHNYLGVFESC
ncbi:hypothetical protein ACJX0J_017595, partial [Zea mays]